MIKNIIVRGARVHNLKNVDVDIPHNKLIVFTGLSGSGKSSLAFDTIYAEGQRRFMESLSSFTKQFMESLDRPDVDQLEGLPPTIAINQRTSSASPRSTVGTATEIYDYLRLMYSRIGIPHCPSCKQAITAKTRQQIISEVQTLLKRKPTETLILVPFSRISQDVSHVIDELQRLGYHFVRKDKQRISVRELMQFSILQLEESVIEIVVDRIEKGEIENLLHNRLIDIIKNALDLGDGTFLVAASGEKELLFTEQLICPTCSCTIKPLEPQYFSFNNPAGACEECTGLGYLLKFDPELLIPNKKLTIAQGAIQPLNKLYANTAGFLTMVEQLVSKHSFSVHTPLHDLTEKQLTVLLHGESSKKVSPKKQEKGDEKRFSGIIPYLEEKYRDTDSEYLQKELEDYMRIFVCPSCNGKRLRPEMLSVTVCDYTIDTLVSFPLTTLRDIFVTLDISKTKKNILSPLEQKIAQPLLKEMMRRTESLIEVGLSYLTLDRSMTTLSGGEAQRVKLANHISSSLVGVVYVLDEPSIGLHPKDTEQLVKTLRKLRDNGNTVIVVEHDKTIIMEADLVVDVGPGAGKQGGHIIATGTAESIMKNSKSITGKYLSGEAEIYVQKKLRGSGKFLEIQDACEFNLKHINVSIPLGKMIFVTGLSGSGKSTLIIEILSKALLKKFNHTKDEPGKHKGIIGMEHIDKIVVIDQAPIGRTPRSNPVTYTNIFTPIRELFTDLPESRIKGFKPGHFSFNVKGGRCETCQGEGMMRIDMRFLSDVYVECRDCKGKRYNSEALEVHYEGLSIADVLDMTVDEAIHFFIKQSTIKEKLQTLSDVGLGYIRLGQPANTLSGGEAQRIKLAAELSRRSTGKTMYILDEPTTGLHFHDIKQLLNILNQLVDKGNTVVVIEHNVDVIKNADWIIDLGPGAGNEGGVVVAEGQPLDIAKNPKSVTGKYLNEALTNKK